jgi:hypothetical protein
MKCKEERLHNNSEVIAKVVKLYEEGYSCRMIGKTLSYTYKSIVRELKKLNVKLRVGRERIVGSTRVVQGRTWIKTKDGWQLRYRVIAAKKFGKMAIVNKDIHHKDDNPLNDSDTNLEPLTRSEHIRQRNLQKRKEYHVKTLT